MTVELSSKLWREPASPSRELPVVTFGSFHADDPSRHTTVPVHKGRDLPRGTLRDIIDQAGLTVGEFIDLL